MKNIIGLVLSGFLMLCVLVSFAACGDNSSLSQKNDGSSQNEQTQNGDDTAQDESGQNDNESELSGNEQSSPEDILQKDWGTVEFSLDGWIQREEEQTFSAGAGTFAQININPNIDCYSELQNLLADDEVLVSVSSDNETVLTVLGENQVLFRAPGNANLSVEYSLKGVTQTRIVNCTVTEDEHDVGCDPMTVGEPGRCLLLKDGKAIASSIGNTESNRDEYLFIFDPAADDPFASQNKSYVELENEAYGLCEAKDRIYFYSLNKIYVLSEDMQTYSEVYDADDYQIYNLFSVDDKLYAELRDNLESMWVMFSPSGDKLDRVKGTAFTFENSGFTAVSYYNGTVHFIGTPKSGNYSGQTNEYVLNLNYMNYFPCTGVNFMNNYAGKSLLGDGITYTLSSNLPYIYTFDWGNTEVIESHQKLVEDAVGAMTYYNGKIYYTELYRSPSSNSEIIHLKLKSYDLSTKEIVELHSGDFFTSKYMSTAGRLCVMNDKLFYLTETYRGYDFPVYNLVTGEVKYCHP